MRRVTKLFNTKATSINEDAKTVTFKISDNAVDRMGEVVDQESWNFKDYMKNPIVLWGHNPNEPENVLGQTTKLEVSGDNSETYATAQFDTDINPKAKLVWNQIKKGTLRTVSVGFMNHSEEMQDDKPVLKDNDLIEWSIVPIPANPRAIALDLKSGALSTKDARWLMESMKSEAEALDQELAARAEEDKPKEKKVDEQTQQQIGALMDAVTTLANGQAETNKKLDALIDQREAEAGVTKAIPAELKKKFIADLADSSKNPTKHITIAIQRLCEWAAKGSYPKNCSYEDLKWMYDQCVKELKKRDPKSEAGGNFPPKKAMTAEVEEKDYIEKCQALTSILSAMRGGKALDDEAELRTKDAETDATDKTAETDDDKQEPDEGKQDDTPDDRAKGGDDDQPGAGDGEIDLEAEMTPELEEQLDKAFADVAA